MSTRIVYICVCAYFLDAFGQLETVSGYPTAGLYHVLSW